jgi:UDP-3-O-[3-hydroxymyristoyl] glucosamine N-acyltransferase
MVPRLARTTLPGGTTRPATKEAAATEPAPKEEQEEWKWESPPSPPQRHTPFLSGSIMRSAALRRAATLDKYGPSGLFSPSVAAFQSRTGSGSSPPLVQPLSFEATSPTSAPLVADHTPFADAAPLETKHSPFADAAPLVAKHTPCVPLPTRRNGRRRRLSAPSLTPALVQSVVKRRAAEREHRELVECSTQRELFERPATRPRRRNSTGGLRPCVGVDPTSARVVLDRALGEWVASCDREFSTHGIAAKAHLAFGAVRLVSDMLAGTTWIASLQQEWACRGEWVSTIVGSGQQQRPLEQQPSVVREELVAVQEQPNVVEEQPLALEAEEAGCLQTPPEATAAPVAVTAPSEHQKPFRETSSFRIVSVVVALALMLLGLCMSPLARALLLSSDDTRAALATTEAVMGGSMVWGAGNVEMGPLGETIIASQQQVEEDTTIASQQQVEEDTVIVSQQQVEEDTTIASQQQVEEDTTIASQQQVEEDTIIVSQQQVEEDTIIVSQQQVEEDTVIVSQQQVEEDTVIASQQQVEKDTVIASQQQVEEDTTIASQQQVEKDTTIASQQQVEEDTIIVSQQQVEEDTIIASQQQVEKDTVIASQQQVEEDTVIASQQQVEEDTVIASQQQVEEDTVIASQQQVEKDTVIASQQQVEKDTVIASPYVAEAGVASDWTSLWVLVGAAATALAVFGALPRSAEMPEEETWAEESFPPSDEQYFPVPPLELSPELPQAIATVTKPRRGRSATAGVKPRPNTVSDEGGSFVAMRLSQKAPGDTVNATPVRRSRRVQAKRAQQRSQSQRVFELETEAHNLTLTQGW